MDVTASGVPPVKFTSCQAPSADVFCGAVVRFIGERLGLRTELVMDLPWKERERRFDSGDIDVCWMCGWPYAMRVDRLPLTLDLIAAPVMADPRYLDQPIYFSDIVVRVDSPFATFEDLEGRAWAYNEPMSHSGYNAVRYFLAMQGRDGGCFRSVVESGSHEASIDLVLNRTIDASAIDSTVLEAIGRRRPEIKPLLRVIGTIGPSPAPPWVVRSSLSRHLRDALRKAFLTMHQSAEGRTILQSAALQRFEPVDDRYYDSIREMAATGSRARL